MPVDARGQRWRDSGNLERAVETAGGQEAFGASVAAMLDDARGWRLAEMRKRRRMTQEQVAVRMGVSVARVSQIESGRCDPSKQLPDECSAALMSLQEQCAALEGRLVSRGIL
jgi:DNA-binding XRE family transcriptional regulator